MIKAEEEILEIVDEEDRIIGRATRGQCHGNPALIHRVVHILIFNCRGEVLLQKRSLAKDVQPGRWDTSVGGHLEPGEEYLEAAFREAREELDLENPVLTFLYFSKIRTSVEAENVATYLAMDNGPFNFDRNEIDELKFWSRNEVGQFMGKDVFTPNFEEEWKIFAEWADEHGESTLAINANLA